MSGNGSSGEEPEYTGFALAATFGLASVLFWVSPDYLGVTGWFRYGLYALGGVSMSLSLYGALGELGKLLELEALGAFGVGVMFLVPALLLHVAASRAEIGEGGISVLKVAALILDLFGGFLTLFGLADLLEAIARRRRRSRTERSRDGRAWLTILSFLSAVLPIAAFLVNTLTDLLG